jgi:hypothetical protein
VKKKRAVRQFVPPGAHITDPEIIQAGYDAAATKLREIFKAWRKTDAGKANYSSDTQRQRKLKESGMEARENMENQRVSVRKDGTVYFL